MGLIIKKAELRTREWRYCKQEWMLLLGVCMAVEYRDCVPQTRLYRAQFSKK
jgi:hypothetical protein